MVALDPAELERKERMEVHPMVSATTYYAATLNTPLVAALFRRAADALVSQGDKPGTWRRVEHEMMDLVLSLDAGYLGLLALHAPMAVAEGISTASIRAIKDHRDDELPEDERRQLHLIRSIVAGNVTEELWQELVERFGSVRGAVEYAFYVNLLQLLIRMHQALGVPSISSREFDDLLMHIDDGSWHLPPSGALTRS
jgi:hypothetical protein